MKQKGKYLIILVCTIILWNTDLIKPLKLFAVFLHELGHAFMSFIFGNGIQQLRISLNESGYAITMPKSWFSAFMIANGGYLGSILFALLILYLKRTKFKKLIMGMVAVILLAVAIKFSGVSFTLLYAAIFAAFVIIIYMLQNEKIEDWVIDIIGVASVAYAIYDTFVDTILLQVNLKLHLLNGWGGTQPMTDAVQLEKMTHIPAVVWGALWLVIAFFAVNAVILKGGSPSKSRKRG